MQSDEARIVHDAALRRARGYSADLSEQDAEDIAQEVVIRFSRQEPGIIENPAAWGVEEARYGFPDADLGPQAIERAVALARHAHRRWRDGARVLIRCQAGVNRSGLVMALTLMNHGLAADDAIALIRRRRGTAVLSNRHFERWLLTEAAQVVGGPSSNERTAA